MGNRSYAEVLQEIQAHPDQHKHTDLNALNQCCFIEGALDLSLIDAHSQYAPLGTNGGVRCDVRQGPCACGAWH